MALKMRPGEITAHCGIFHCITLGNTASESDHLTLSCQIRKVEIKKKILGGRVGASIFWQKN